MSEQAARDQRTSHPRANSFSHRNLSLSPVASLSQSPSTSTRMPPDSAYADAPTRATKGGADGRKRARTASTTGDDRISPGRDVKFDPKGENGMPSVLVREKKQKACANCRRAKLKCIVEDNETDCVRCRARKERCIFYPRGHVSRLFVCG